MSKKGKKRKRTGPQDATSEPSTAKPEPRAPHRPVIPSLTELRAAAAVAQPLTASKKFLTASDGPIYQQTLRDHYAGFVHLPSTQLSAPFHTQSKLALEKLRDAGYYQYDMVMAGGKNLSRTFVQRTLVGDPGITYKYLGLRLFAHAWSGPGCTDVFRGIYQMNQEMIRLTHEQLGLYQASKAKSPSINVDNLPPPPNGPGSCEYNLTLINYMEPSSETTLRDEEMYGMGKASVSWHADSSLQDYSSIGVYHTLPTQRASTWDWKIALRRNPESSNDAHAPPVVVPTKSGDVYFLLREFNHTHQHMVLAGSSARRISSTHRVAVVATDTYEYIRARCSQALVTTKVQLKRSVAEWNVAVVLDAQAVLTEVEFEWIAQYWVQGAQHDVQHVWWQAPMRALEQAWNALEKLSFKMYTGVMAAATDGTSANVRELLTGLHKAFVSRQEWRTKWNDRRADKIYKRRISRPYQPVEHPVFDVDTSKRLPKDLAESIAQLAHALTNLEGVHATTNQPRAESVPASKAKRNLKIPTSRHSKQPNQK